MLNLESEAMVRRARYQDLLREAEQDRLLQAAHPRGERRQIGRAIVRLRCRLPVLNTTGSCIYQLTAS